jgi:hypothetical protein
LSARVIGVPEYNHSSRETEAKVAVGFYSCAAAILKELFAWFRQVVEYILDCFADWQSCFGVVVWKRLDCSGGLKQILFVLVKSIERVSHVMIM